MSRGEESTLLDLFLTLLVALKGSDIKGYTGFQKKVVSPR